MSTVALVITSYNEGERLRAALNAIPKWTRRPDEIVVVDDGSVDRESNQVANFYADPALRFVPGARVWPTKFVRHTVNQGVSYAMAEGLRHVTADYVWFGSVGDEYHPDFLRRALLRDGNLISAWGRIGRFPVGKLPGDLTPYQFREQGPLLLSHVTLARTELARRSFRPDLKWHCDFHIHSTSACHGGVQYVDLDAVRIRNQKTSYSRNGERSPEHEKILRELAFEFQYEPALLGHFGWPMVRILWQERQLDGFTGRFWYHCLRRMAGKCLTKLG